MDASPGAPREVHIWPQRSIRKNIEIDYTSSGEIQHSFTTGQLVGQIADWLTKLDLGEYAQRFADNGIDFGVLPELTDHDLEKLGVLLGHRRKILRAIADNRAAVEALRRDEVERRQLTVMFCDLVGSTALSTRLDVEDFRDVIAAYHGCCAEAIKHEGGLRCQIFG